MAANTTSTPAKPPLAYAITASLPTPDEYITLRRRAGLTIPPPETPVARALATTVRCVVARLPSDSPSAADAGRAIGMLRMVGDGVIMCTLCDMAVDPEFQGRGVGGALADAMLAWADAHAPHAYLSLIGDPPGQALYRSRGFVQTRGIGMKRSAWGQ